MWLKGEWVVMRHRAIVRGRELRVKYACHQSIVLSGEEGATCYHVCGECFGDEQNANANLTVLKVRANTNSDYLIPHCNSTSCNTRSVLPERHPMWIFGCEQHTHGLVGFLACFTFATVQRFHPCQFSLLSFLSMLCLVC